MISAKIRQFAPLILGNIEGLNYTKTNLKLALETQNYKIKDVCFGDGFKFIKIKDSNTIECSKWSYNKNDWENLILTLDEFWNKTKHRKNQILIIKNE